PPQIVPTQRAQLPQRRGLTRARPGQQLDRSSGHRLRLSIRGYREAEAKGSDRFRFELGVGSSDGHAPARAADQELRRSDPIQARGRRSTPNRRQRSQSRTQSPPESRPDGSAPRPASPPSGNPEEPSRRPTALACPDFPSGAFVSPRYPNYRDPIGFPLPPS